MCGFFTQKEYILLYKKYAALETHSALFLLVYCKKHLNEVFCKKKPNDGEINSQPNKEDIPVKSKLIPRILICLSILIFAGLIFSLFNSFYGNPVSAAIATSKIKSYVNHTYPDLNLEVPSATYNFKTQGYYSQVKSGTSPDTCFSVSWSDGGLYDTYEYDVEKRDMTYRRLQTELDKTVEGIIQTELPYETSILLADFVLKEGDTNSLKLDMPLDIKNPPLPVSLTVDILTDEISYENLSARLLELSDLMKEYEIPVALFSVIIQEPAAGGEKAAPEGQSLYLYDFPSEKITEPDLIASIKEHQKEWEEENNKE